ncbi:peptidoglycan D,D-transpeptidase FtsI family protein [Catellatospora bangladeshensis]|uniref:Penicillin-binding protein A n=1 Tax=Catellatospora bangladeshensis TaxID=310355 RepID=A0A8J3NIU4_9ACTN|nr:penicillin-binding transpeptidase domain-containing protein [Catellatospora bangladeshensis]GIF81223.1 penicillin-binding protein A [Catellatospora bangladeshensis]
MNAPLRRVGVVVMVLFGLLFANLNWVQAYKGNDYRTSQYNDRVQIDEYNRQRGYIMVSNPGSKPIALSTATKGNLKYLRSYPNGAAYAHVIGYKPVNGAATGIEQLENDFLSGTSDKLFADRLRDIFTGSYTAGGNVTLTLSKTAQDTAYKELTGNKVGAKSGAVIALDPNTGAILAMTSFPSFDPNPLVAHDTGKAAAAYNKVAGQAGNPLLNRALQETYPPASTFKVLVSAAALENGNNPDTPLQAGPGYQAPGTTHVIKNATSGTCPESQITLKEALTVSCNTAYARLGVELGSQRLNDTVRRWGYYDDDLRIGNLSAPDRGTKVPESVLGPLTTSSGGDDKPAIAISSIGLNEVKVTPLQNAMVAAAIANDCSQMRPYLVERLVGPDLTTNLYAAAPKQLRTTCSNSSIAAQLREMMVSVVENGTGRKAQIDGYVVGGKTGTGTADEETNTGSDGWFIGFAMKDGKPLAAVAVILDDAGKGGSGEAARIAGLVMHGVIKDKGGK